MKIVNGILNFNSDEEFIKNTYNKRGDINYYVFEKIKAAVDLNITQVVLFKIYLGNSHMVIKLKEIEWVEPLEKCLKYFELNEKYELCKECLTIIQYIKEKLLV